MTKHSTIAPLDPPLEEVMNLLYEHHGKPVVDDEEDDILATLIEALLSQATNRRNFELAFARLLDRFDGDWEKVARGDVEAIEEAIQVGGLAKQKAARIQAILHRAHELYGAYSLEAMHEEEPQKAYARLVSMPGVGPKSATFVLMRAANMPFFSMSTRILRICQRLGWGSEKCSSQAAHDRILPHIPKGEHDPFHMVMIEHGKALCLPREPRCGQCPLNHICQAGRRREHTQEVEPPSHEA